MVRKRESGANWANYLGALWYELVGPVFGLLLVVLLLPLALFDEKRRWGPARDRIRARRERRRSAARERLARLERGERD